MDRHRDFTQRFFAFHGGTAGGEAYFAVVRRLGRRVVHVPGVLSKPPFWLDISTRVWSHDIWTPRAQAGLHIAILLGCVCPAAYRPGGALETHSSNEPAWQILFMLTVTIGLPCPDFSATSPLLQSWLARRGDEAPYGLFAVRIFFSRGLARLSTRCRAGANLSRQSMYWSILFALFALVCGAVAWQSRGAPTIGGVRRGPNVLRPLYWFGLAACGSMLLLSVTNHMTENVAAVPLLWVLPLAMYLLQLRPQLRISARVSALVVASAACVRSGSDRVCHLQHRHGRTYSGERTGWPELFIACMSATPNCAACAGRLRTYGLLSYDRRRRSGGCHLRGCSPTDVFRNI